MASHGNEAARATFESRVPSFYYRPTQADCQVLREQWIRAKYERQEFLLPEKQEPYSAGYREGFLWKRGRDNGQFLSRKFVLTEREGALKYFNKNDAKEPKAVMKIEHLNATFQPAKIGHPHGLQLTYLKDNSTRNIFLYHDDGKEVVDWFNALRAARFHYLQVAFPGASDADLVPKLSRNYLKEGYMEKTGPKQTEGFRKRWFTMDDRRLMTPSPAGRSSSAARRAATRCWGGSRRPPRATTGRTASPLSRPTASSCSPVRRRRTSGSGCRPSRRWWTGPCCPRSMQWKPTSSISPSEQRRPPGDHRRAWLTWLRTGGWAGEGLWTEGARQVGSAQATPGLGAGPLPHPAPLEYLLCACCGPGAGPGDPLLAGGPHPPGPWLGRSVTQPSPVGTQWPVCQTLGADNGRCPPTLTAAPHPAHPSLLAAGGPTWGLRPSCRAPPAGDRGGPPPSPAWPDRRGAELGERHPHPGPRATSITAQAG
ncbi:arf-GAP with dual PH domain-containing protein 1 isoform X1 [Lepus europaeus]|uniref:arf-GAP with dual PH domain-containing protein 1 isoform X1 n=1 Tax=Lepus europaeus TaxID=9983 RepID=UPI002B47E9EB|nr:arf-GAP with dual PH domain-containing protein 1 isoform X1 [Lepus europaeus]